MSCFFVFQPNQSLVGGKINAQIGNTKLHVETFSTKNTL